MESFESDLVCNLVHSLGLQRNFVCRRTLREHIPPRVCACLLSKSLRLRLSGRHYFMETNDNSTFEKDPKKLKEKHIPTYSSLPNSGSLAAYWLRVCPLIRPIYVVRLSSNRPILCCAKIEVKDAKLITGVL